MKFNLGERLVNSTPAGPEASRSSLPNLPNDYRVQNYSLIIARTLLNTSITPIPSRLHGRCAKISTTLNEPLKATQFELVVVGIN